jgi:TonB family protein
MTPKLEQPKPVQVKPDTFIPPRVIPKEIPKVEAPETTEPVKDTKLTDDVPATGGVAGGVADGGVVGGTVGGSVGGTLGGEVGGVIGGEVGGEKGGVLGGQLGGTVGGTGSGTEGEGKGADAGPLHVGGDVKAPVVTQRVDPNYNELARKARISGVVIVEAIVNKDGDVKQVKVIKGLPMGLSEEAVEAVKRWHFKPGTLNGHPVDVIFNLTVNFHLG